ncbi:hypothetical protein RRV45_02285 [Bacillus sp. DTU_2020_1000418_1_SI_GHA_SEK_038]|uniref:hypothetical protein n=1 Tax=Bacillus sp. DTU_2020_1000418_1_SI_GHA_SEK_038 TaxID=3077585 RepID=UPI0028E86738|nr:hypothetical protein [Bacillus sp. DTU_2020_1000418_1_SI_GHA_SEK_038]WNS75883.1 hypothetical protein RRV45_02285 [Bacillus sp. DTU_2020_1000418_1_SI_GHA_SEK_038]
MKTRLFCKIAEPQSTNFALPAAIAITVFTAGQNGFVTDFPEASQSEVLAGGVKYAFYFVTGISIVGLICSFFVKKSSAVEEKSPAAVRATEPVRG